MSEILLQSKLKRLKISCIKEGNRIIIGKPKTDKTTLFGLVLLPLIIALLIFILMMNSGFLYSKAIIFIIGLILLAIYNFGRIGKKLGQNNTQKILENNCLRISNKNEFKKFDNKNIIKFYYDIKASKEIIYEGNILLKDSKNTIHQILGFDDEDEKLLKNDLNWIINYFKDYVKLN